MIGMHRERWDAAIDAERDAVEAVKEARGSAPIDEIEAHHLLMPEEIAHMGLATGEVRRRSSGLPSSLIV
jgi:hypothetical protein